MGSAKVRTSGGGRSSNRMRSARPSGQGPASILIVDDSAVARLAVARRLRAEGFDVVEQHSATFPVNGTIARVACALLDLDLGDLDGGHLALALRAARADLPIAFFSGSAAHEVVERASAVGPIFAKPAQLEEAIAWVRANAAR
jgi:DNA-binding response OmpR family regulator